MKKNDELIEIDIKNCKYHFFDDMININDFNPKNIKVDKKSFKDILIYYIEYETSDGVELLFASFNRINEYIEDYNGSKYLALISVDENKGKIRKYNEAWTRIKYLIELQNNDSGNYDKKCMKIRFNSNNNFPLKQELKIS